MKIFVKAKPRSKEEKIEKVDGDHYVVSVKEPPVEGRANRAIIRLIAEFFNTSPSRVSIISGHTSRQKIVEVL